MISVWIISPYIAYIALTHSQLIVARISNFNHNLIIIYPSVNKHFKFWFYDYAKYSLVYPQQILEIAQITG